MGMDALAGSCIVVVKPCTTIGTMLPFASFVAWTSAPVGIAAAMELSAGAGPVTVNVRVSTLAGMIMVVVEPGTWMVTVETLGVGATKV